MALRGFVLGAACLAAGVLPAAADSLTATVGSWNPASRTLVFADKSQIQGIPATVAVPETLAAGQTVRITFTGTEDGFSSIQSVDVQP